MSLISALFSSLGSRLGAAGTLFSPSEVFFLFHYGPVEEIPHALEKSDEKTPWAIYCGGPDKYTMLSRENGSTRSLRGGLPDVPAALGYIFNAGVKYIVRIAAEHYDDLPFTLINKMIDEARETGKYVLFPNETVLQGNFLLEVIPKAALAHLRDDRILPNNRLNVDPAFVHYHFPGPDDYSERWLNRGFEIGDVPPNLSLDIVNNCNYRCKKCPQFVEPQVTRHPPGTEMISWRRYADLVEQMSQNKGPWTITTSNRGESLMHPEIARMVELTTESGGKHYILSNGSLLTGQMSEALLKAGLHSFWLSIDAMDPEKYNAVNYPGNLEKVLRNIDTFLENRRRFNARCYFTVHVVSQQDNDGTVEKVIERWGDEIDTLLDAALVDRHSVPSVRISPFWDTLPPALSCLFPWHVLAVTALGEIIPCCGGYMYPERLGTIEEARLADVWRGEKMERLRTMILTGTLPEDHFCSLCDGRYSFFQGSQTADEKWWHQDTPLYRKMIKMRQR